ncbi:hypothetical protein D3C78_710580 [compost metagenome]
MILVGAHDHRVLGGQHVVADQQLLVELLARAQAAELDGDVAVRLVLRAHAEAGEMHHLLRQLGDLHRLAHVQHEHVAACAHRAGLDHQLRRFRDGHEVAGDFRVGHGDRPAALDLLAEQRNHRAGRAQHVAETHHGEARAVGHRRLALHIEQCHLLLGGQRLQDQLGHALGAAHHVGRAHRLVGGNQHEVAHPGAQRGLRGMQGAHGVVQHALGDVVLDHRHMLVGGGVIDGVDPPGTHHIQHPRGVAHRAEDRHQAQLELLLADALLQLDLDAVQVEFRMLEEDQRGRLARQDLPAQLGTDRTTGAGHHHHLAADAALEQLALRFHRVAAEQVGDIHLLQVGDLDPAVGQIHEARHRAHMHRQRLEHLENLAAAGARGGRNRQENLLRPGFLEHPLDMPRAVHRQPGNHPLGQVAVIVDEGHRTHGAVHAQRLGQLVAGDAGAVDRHPRLAVILRAEGQGSQVEPVAGEVLTHGHAQAADQQQAQPPVVEDHRARNQRRRVAVEEDHQGQQQRRQRHRLGDGDQRLVAQVAHHRPVHAQADEQRQGHRRGGEEQPGMRAERLDHADIVETDIERQPQRQPDQQHIDGDLQQALVAAGKRQQALTQRRQIPFHEYVHSKKPGGT